MSILSIQWTIKEYDMSRFTNAYYVSHDFAYKPFFMGPYDVLEDAEKAYNSCKGEEDLQIIKIQVIK